jgi:hypothetical protein
MPAWILVTSCLYVLGGGSVIEDGSLLVESLNNAGLELHSGDTPHKLSVDQAQFLKVPIPKA